MMNNPDEERNKRRKAGIALFGALLLGSFLAFSGFQSQIFSGIDSVAQQGSFFPVVSTVTPTVTPDTDATATVTGTNGVDPVVAGAGAGAVVAGSLIPTPTAVATDTPTATTVATEGPLTVPFINANGVDSTLPYSGTLNITVSGTGQAQGSQYNDAFYIYTDKAGNAITPVNSKGNGLLCINKKPVDTFAQSVPAYSSSHTYSFTINAPGGKIKFGVCDAPGFYKDNTGSFTVTFH